jgi:hypothetical protein
MNKTWKEIVDGLSEKTTIREWVQLDVKSYNWATDPTSMLDIHRQKGSGMPLDPVIRNYANLFFKAVVARNIPDLKMLIELIDERPAELKQNEVDGPWIDLAIFDNHTITYFKVRKKWSHTKVKEFLAEQNADAPLLKYFYFDKIEDKR